MNHPRTRRAVHLGLLLVTAAATVMVVSGYSGGLRPVAALTTAALLPGAAVLSRLPALDVTNWLGLAVVISLIIEAALALGMVWSGWWNPALLAAALGGVSCVVLALDLRRPRLHQVANS